MIRTPNSTVNETKQHFPMPIPENRKVLAKPYWIPKMHKSTILLLDLQLKTNNLSLNL